MNNSCDELISVIIPVYNNEKYLVQCIESIIGQTYPKIEVVLIDDGSTDNSGQICDSYADKYSQIKVFHSINKGISNARNTGIKKAQGKYIVFIDSDDYYEQDAIEKMYNALISNDADICMCGLRTFDENGTIKNHTFNDCEHKTYDEKSFWKELYKSNSRVGVLPCNKLCKKSVYDKAEYPIGRIHEDEAVLHKLIAASRKTVIINDILYNYRQHPSSIMHQKFDVRRLDKCMALAERLDYFFQKGYTEFYMPTFGIGVDVLRKAFKDNEVRRMHRKELDDIYYIYKKNIIDMRDQLPGVKIQIMAGTFCTSIRVYDFLQRIAATVK